MRSAAYRRLHREEARDGRAALAAIALAAMAAAGCGGAAVPDCERLVKSREYESAAQRCREAFERSGALAAAVGAARADSALGRDDAVLAWVERLRGSDQEAAVLSLRAAVYRKRGEAARGRADLERQRTLFGAAGDRREAARSAYRLYYDAWEASEHRRAIEWAVDAFTNASAAADEDVALSALEALFTSLREVGDLEGARTALAEAQRRTPADDRPRRARLLAGEGLVRLEENRPALARDAFLRALALMAAGDDRRSLRSIHLNVVHADLELREVERAARDLQEAWRYAEPDGSRRTALLYYQGRIERLAGRPAAALEAFREALAADAPGEWSWQLELEAGRAWEALGDVRRAEAAYERSAAGIEAMRQSLGVDDLKASLLSRKREPYEALVRLRAGRGRAAAALDAAERAGARAFLDAAVSAARREAPAGGSWLLEASARLSALQEVLPALAESPVVRTRPVNALVRAVGGRHVRVYFEADGELWLIVISRGTVTARRLPGAAGAVREALNRLLAAPDDAPAAAALGEMLLPAGSLPAAGSRMAIVADGTVGLVPFAALRVAGRPLVSDYVVTTAPSVNAWAVLQERPEAPAARAVVVGDPREDLPGARAEARAVGAALDVQPQLGPAATRERLRAAAGAELLHLATHTTWGPGGPRLLLADGDFSAETILRERLRARLVVVATCASASARGRDAWGSLALAFLAAGSRSVVASLWSVEDGAARRLMARFYAEGAADPPLALARAQRWAIAQGWPASAWAPFVVFGSGEGPKGAHGARSR